MDYRQFMMLMVPGEETGKDSINKLQEFVNEFPYFQSAHALLAKSMHEQQHVRYEKQLKIAAAYAGDRKSLYNLIQGKKTILINDIKTNVVPLIVEPLVSEVENVFVESVNETDISPVIQDIFIDSPKINHIEEEQQFNVYKEENTLNEKETSYNDELPVADPHDIIRRRLIQILGLKEEIKEEIISEKSHEELKIDIENTPITNPINSTDLKKDIAITESIISSDTPFSKKDILDQLAEESIKAVDFIQKAEIEYALESTLIQSLEKLPLIENQIINEKLFTQQAKRGNSFYDWLKIKSSPGYGEIEEVHAYQPEAEQTNTEIGQDSELTDFGQIKDKIDEKKLGNLNHLIDRFIQADPKIIPSKTEFYSPATQAKKSITENEDVVSETLAKIYHQQGNFLKARSSYQKLSLLYPKKLAYFAALISELDKVINNLDKQDL